MNVTLCVLNETTETLDWAGAKNPLWVVKHSKANLEEIQPSEHPSNNLKPFTTHRIKISGGDSVYMFSNGQTNQLIEEKGSRDESKELKKLLLDLRDQNMSTQKKALNKAFESWQEGLKQLENFCMIGVRLPIKENNPFTRREKEVLQLLDQGQSSKIIADELNISKSTVDTHRKNLLKKLVGAKSSFFPIREASHGVSVNPTNKLVKVDVITTTENCLSISATNTCKNKIGRNTTTSTNVIESAENPISIRPSIDASRFPFPMSRWR
jgi:hypothetical protein